MLYCYLRSTIHVRLCYLKNAKTKYIVFGYRYKFNLRNVKFQIPLTKCVVFMKVQTGRWKDKGVKTEKLNLISLYIAIIDSLIIFSCITNAEWTIEYKTFWFSAIGSQHGKNTSCNYFSDNWYPCNTLTVHYLPCLVNCCSGFSSYLLSRFTIDTNNGIRCFVSIFFCMFIISCMSTSIAMLATSLNHIEIEAKYSLVIFFYKYFYF